MFFFFPRLVPSFLPKEGRRRKKEAFPSDHGGK